MSTEVERAKLVRNRVIISMAMLGETQEPNWQEEACIRSMIAFAENERLLAGQAAKLEVSHVEQ